MTQSNTTFKGNFLIISFSIWWFFWSMLQMALLQDFGIDPVKSVIDSLVSNILLAAFCLIIFNNMKFYLPGKERFYYVFVISLALSSIWLFLCRAILRLIYSNDAVYIKALSQSMGIRYAFAFLMLVAITLISIIWYSGKDEKERSEIKKEIEQLSREAELNKLRQQLQPHFLFNSLNSISSLTASQPEKARHMIQQLAEFLRGTLKKEDQQWTSFEEELQYLQLYLDIEKVRFGYRLTTSIEYDDEVLQLKLPCLILQPVLENAIKYGLYDTTGEVNISLTAKFVDNSLYVTVSNPFDDNLESPLKGTGFGLTSVRKRLFILYGRQDLLIIRKDDGYFQTTIIIPQ